MADRASLPQFQGQQFAESLNDAVVLLDAEGKMQWWNHAASKVLGLNVRCHHHMAITCVLTSMALKDNLLRSERGNLECPSPIEPDRMLSIVLIPYEQDQCLLVAQDISHLHHINKMRRDFVANVSHELRTPLTVMRGYLELMQQQKEQLPGEWLPNLEDMAVQTARMQYLVEDLLLLSRLENQAVDLKSWSVIDVPELLTSLISEARSVGNNNHEFVTSIDHRLKLKGHENEIRSAFSNLIINAVRYTPKNGVITIAWHHDKTGAHLGVKDTGIGIAEDDIPRITERFYRADKGRSRSSGGTGLGLSIVKHVLLRHEASLFIRSDLGQGSAFWCDFPQALVFFDES